MVEANEDVHSDSEEEEEQMTIEEANEKLFEAVKDGDVEFAHELLDKNAAMPTFEKDSWNPLLWASCNGNEEMVRLLIKFNAHTPYQKSQKGMDEANNADSGNNAGGLDDEESNPFTKPPDSQKVGKYTPLHWASY